MRRFILPGLLTLALTSAALADEVTIPTAQGEVSIAAKPDVIAVLDMAAIDTLQALGVMPDGRPNELYIDYLPDVEEAAAPVGTLFEPNLEALAVLGPDLIIIGGRSAGQLESVSQIAPSIDMTIGIDLISDAKARLAAYGTLFGKEDQAARMAAALDEKLAKTRDAGKGKGSALMVMTNGPKMAAYGTNSRFGWIFDATGLEEASNGLKGDTHGDAITHEFIAEADPDWLIVLDRSVAVGEGGQSAEATLKSPLIAETKAWKSGQIIYLDPASSYISGGGYRSLSTGLEQLAKALNSVSEN